jgi:hypothetical protein
MNGPSRLEQLRHRSLVLNAQPSDWSQTNAARLGHPQSVSFMASYPGPCAGGAETTRLRHGDTLDTRHATCRRRERRCRELDASFSYRASFLAIDGHFGSPMGHRALRPAPTAANRQHGALREESYGVSLRDIAQVNERPASTRPRCSAIQARTRVACASGISYSRGRLPAARMISRSERTQLASTLPVHTVLRQARLSLPEP